MLRIGVLFEYATLNGGEHSILATIERLHGRRCEFVMIAPETGPLVRVVDHTQLPRECLTLRTVTGARVSQPFLLQQLQRFIAAHRLDLLHANSLTMGRHLGAIADRLPVPTTTHLRDIMSLSRSAIHDLNQHQRLIAVSDATRTFHLQQGLDAHKTRKIYNGIDCQKFQPRPVTGELRKALNIPNNALLAATIGQICLRKAQLDLAHAAVLVHKTSPEMHYLLVGERHSSKQESIEFEKQISATFTAAGVADRLHLMGQVDNIPQLLNEVDLVIHPARQEPLGRVLLEAAASGVPIVATNVGGTSEILSDGESGILVPPGDPAALETGINRLHKSSQLREQFARAARQQIVEKFNIDRSADLLSVAWESLF